VYFYADYSDGTISYLTFESDGSETVKSNTLLDGGHANIISITSDFEGNLWITRRTKNHGIVEKLTYSNAFPWNTPPTVSKINASVVSGTFATAPLSVQFTSDASDADIDRGRVVVGKGADGDAELHSNSTSFFPPDRETQELTYLWIFGDGSESTSATPTHMYMEAGVFDVHLYISDGIAQATSKLFTITVGTPPSAAISWPINGSSFRAGETITAFGSGQIFNPETSSMENISIVASSTSGNHHQQQHHQQQQAVLTWEIDLIHDNHLHSLSASSSEMMGSSINFTFPFSGHTYEGNVGVQFSLTATTGNGKLSFTESVQVWPEMVEQVIESHPEGLQIIVDSRVTTTPFAIRTTPGFKHNIAVPTGCIGGKWFDLKKVTGLFNSSTGMFKVEHDNSTLVFDYVDARVQENQSACTSSAMPSLTVCADFSGNGMSVNCIAAGCKWAGSRTKICSTPVATNDIPTDISTTITINNTVCMYTHNGMISGACLLERNKDYYGNDLKGGSKSGSSVADCTKYCLAQTDCSHFTYLKGKCYLKSSGTGATQHKDAISAECETNPGFAAAAACTPEPPTDTSTRTNTSTSTSTSTSTHTTSQPITAGTILALGQYETLLPGPCKRGCKPGNDWADSYELDGRCYCDVQGKKFGDHGIFFNVVDTGYGNKTVADICNDIFEKFGDPGKGDKTKINIYNTVACGNPPYNNADDEDANACPGRVDYGAVGCRTVGPMWDYKELYHTHATTTTIPTTTTTTTLAPCGDAVGLVGSNCLNRVFAIEVKSSVSLGDMTGLEVATLQQAIKNITVSVTLLTHADIESVELSTSGKQSRTRRAAVGNTTIDALIVLKETSIFTQEELDTMLTAIADSIENGEFKLVVPGLVLEAASVVADSSVTKESEATATEDARVNREKEILSSVATIWITVACATIFLMVAVVLLMRFNSGQVAGKNNVIDTAGNPYTNPLQVNQNMRLHNQEREEEEEEEEDEEEEDDSDSDEGKGEGQEDLYQC
jgi:hypothetical protein